MAISKDLLDWVCSQVRALEERLAEAQALYDRMRRAGMATADMELRLRQLAEQLQRLRQAFPECAGLAPA